MERKTITANTSFITIDFSDKEREVKVKGINMIFSEYGKINIGYCNGKIFQYKALKETDGKAIVIKDSEVIIFDKNC